MKEEINHPTSVEDIFSDEIFSERLLKGDIREEEFMEGEQVFASDLLRAISSGKDVLPADQKLLLDERISNSIDRFKRKKVLVWLSSAAVLLLVVGLTFFLKFYQQSDILNYASSISVVNDLEYTRLLLPGQNCVRIETAESKIAYSKSGKEIRIDSEKEITQSAGVGAELYNTVVVPYGKRSRILLSDSSVIWLNSGSKLVYPACFTEGKREVYLDGEALFEVAPDKNHPFHVLTSSMEVKVLGTVFDLCAYSEDSTFNTVLEHGSVELMGKKSLFGNTNGEKMVPGMLAVYNLSSNSFVQTSVDTKNYTSWKDGYLILENQSLESIVKKLSRYYNVSIEFDSPELAVENFSGYLDLRSSAMQVLLMIAEIVDVEVIQSDRIIKIRKK